MTDNNKLPIPHKQGDLFARVTSILEEARANTVRAINRAFYIVYSDCVPEIRQIGTGES